VVIVEHDRPADDPRVPSELLPPEPIAENRHSVAEPALWDTYGVVAPFPTLVIDDVGTIVSRQWGFTPGLEEQIRSLLRSRFLPGSGP